MSDKQENTPAKEQITSRGNEENTPQRRKDQSQSDQKRTQADRRPAQEYRHETYHKPKCNVRIEELAKPLKHQVRTVYTGYKHILPKRNVEAVTTFLQEEYAKTLEEAEQMFRKMRRNFKEGKCRKACKKEAKKKHTDKIREEKKQNMLDLLVDILKKCMMKAYANPMQLIMTNRLRTLSDIILLQLCEIRNITVPQRESTTIRASLMYTVADFFAFCVDSIYYELQVRKVKDYEELPELPPAPKRKRELPSVMIVNT